MPRRIEQQTIIEMREFYKNNPISIKNIANKFNVSAPTAGKILKDLPRWTKTKIFNPNLKENWFETIDNQNKAYYLGLFITDGNVHPILNKSTNCNITLSNNDEYLLQTWLQLVESNRQIAHDGRGCAQAVVMSDKMAADLSKYGIVPNKTLNTYLPSLESDMMPHLIRGLIDGDGSIEAKWYTPKDGRKRFKHRISLCGTHQLCQQASDFLTTELQLRVQQPIYDYQNKNLSEISFTNYEDIKKVGDYIYKDAENYMLRKKEKFDMILQRINDMETVC